MTVEFKEFLNGITPFVNDVMCCLEIDTPGNSETLWRKINIKKEDNIYLIDILSDDVILHVPVDSVKLNDDFIEIIKNKIEIFITPDSKHKSEGDLNTFGILLENFSKTDVVTLSEDIVQTSGSIDKNVKIRHASQIISKKGEHQKIIDNIVMMLSSNTMPFYAEFMTFLNSHESLNIPTMGVNVSRKGMNLYWNRKFVDDLKSSELLFVMVHECMHLLFDHTKRSIFYNKELANICQDMIINTIINDDLVKKVNNKNNHGELITIPKYNNEYHQNQDGTDLLDANGNKIKNKMYNKNMGLFLPVEFTGEPIFEILYEWMKDKYQDYKERKEQQGQGNQQQGQGNQPSQDQGNQPSQDQGNQQQGQGNQQQDQGNQQQGQGNQPSQDQGNQPSQDQGNQQQGQGNQPSQDGGQGEPTDSFGNPSYGPNGQGGVDCSSLDSIFDSYDKGEQLTLDSHLEDEVPGDARKSIINDFTQRLKNRGLVTSDVEATLGKLIKSKKDYLKEIKRVTSNHIIGTSKKKSITRPNRRGIEGIKGKKKFKNVINCVLDTSGSMGNEFDKVLSYLYQNDIHINLIQIDTEVKCIESIKNKRELQNMVIKGMGGTVLQPAISYIADVKNKLSAFNTIILTDGYTDTLNFTEIKGNSLILTTGTEPRIVDPRGKVKIIKIDLKESLHSN